MPFKTGESISCLIPKVFFLNHPKIQPSLKTCSKQRLAANQGKVGVEGEFAVEMKIALRTFDIFF